MNILAFDTVLNKTYIALCSGEKTVSKIVESDDKNYHSAYLISSIEQILKENNVSINKLDAIGVNCGPGSFSGIRVGLTAARVMGQQLNIKTVGVPSVEILKKAYESNNCVVLDARRSQFYFYEGNKITLLQEKEVLDLITDDKTVICDSGSERILQGKKIINFEKQDCDLGIVLLKIVQQKLAQNKTDDFSWAKLKPLYIQTPPIHSKTKA